MRVKRTVRDDGASLLAFSFFLLVLFFLILGCTGTLEREKLVCSSLTPHEPVCKCVYLAALSSVFLLILDPRISATRCAILLGIPVGEKHGHNAREE